MMRVVFRTVRIVLLFVVVSTGKAEPQFVKVDDDWSGIQAGQVLEGFVFGSNAFATIQGAIQAVDTGGVLQVSPGTYHELINYLGKAITVRSESGPTNTLIDGAG